VNWFSINSRYLLLSNFKSRTELLIYLKKPKEINKVFPKYYFTVGSGKSGIISSSILNKFHWRSRQDGKTDQVLPVHAKIEWGEGCLVYFYNNQIKYSLCFCINMI